MFDEDAGLVLIASQRRIDRRSRRSARDPDREGPHQLEVAYVGERITDIGHLPVEHGGYLVTNEGEVPGLGIAVHQRDTRFRRGSLSVELCDQSLERRERSPLDATHLTRPVVQLAVEVGRAIAQLVQPGRAQVDEVDRGELVDEAVAHARDALGIGVELGRHDALVYVARNPLHDVERPAQHLAGRFQPKRARCPHRRWLQRSQDAELTLQVVRLQQTG